MKFDDVKVVVVIACLDGCTNSTRIRFEIIETNLDGLFGSRVGGVDLKAGRFKS